MRVIAHVLGDIRNQDCGGADLSGEGGMQRRRKVVAAAGTTFSPVNFTWVTMYG